MFVQIEPTFDTAGNVKGGKAVAMSQGYPRSPKGGTALVFLELEIPASAFDPIASVRVVIPESSVTCTVEVDTP